MRSIPLLAAAIVALSALPAAFAGAQSWPDGYWDRQYSFGQQFSAMYNVTLKVKSVSEASEKAAKILEQAGARAQNGFGGYGQAQSVRLNYLIPVDKADKTAKRLFELGDLQQFSNQKMGSSSQLPEVREKIAAIEAEQKANAATLENMPVARTLLSAQLARLTQTRAALEASVGTAILNVTLIDASAPESSVYNGSGSIRRAPQIPATPEVAAKAALGSVRSALSIYYGDTEGHYPAKLSDLTAGGKYLAAVPRIRVADHAETDAVTNVTGVSDMEGLKKKLKDTGGWAYVSDPKSKLFGTVVIDCAHSDSRSSAWDSY